MRKGKRILINLFSIIFLSTLVLFYGYRLFYFYALEHQVKPNEQITLYQKLMNDKKLIGFSYGLETDENTRYFNSNATNNYLYYLGRMWRIVEINENNNIKIVTDESQTLLTWEENKTFEESDVNKWLNISDDEHSGIFEKSLRENPYLVKTDGKYVSLLTEKQINRLDKNNYLISKPFWIISDTKAYVNNKGEIVKETSDYDALNVKPVITINETAPYISGTGTKDDPYIIYNHENTYLSNAYVGEYLKYNDSLWRIIETDETSVKVVLDGFLDEQQAFSNRSDLFNLKEGIGLFLNEYYTNLVDNDYIVQKEYYLGRFSDNNNYSYLNTYDESLESYIGLLKVGDFFINDYSGIFTLTPSETSSKTIYTINQNERLFVDFIDSKHYVRPVINLSNELFILNGNGMKNSPYEIGR